MVLKIRQRLFINELEIEIQEPRESSFKATLKDEKGTVCRALEVATDQSRSLYKWHGLNELPYGVYTCEISGGIGEMTTQVVKRL